LRIDSSSNASDSYSVLRWKIITRPLCPNTSPLTEDRR
jgi:hypothetical protein